MGIENGGLVETYIGAVEDIDEIDQWNCFICGGEEWVRLIAIYAKGSCWVTFCGECGTVVQKRWSIR